MDYHFIAFEGIDGSGKTLQSQKFAEDFRYIWTFEPTDGKIGQKIRCHLAKKDLPPMKYKTCLLKTEKST